MREACAQAEGLRPPEPLEVVSVRLMTPEAQLRWAALERIVAERRRQHELWGQQNWPLRPDGMAYWAGMAESAKDREQKARAAGVLCWSHILLEEVYEALASCTIDEAVTELTHVAALAVQIIEGLDAGRIALEPPCAPE